MNEHEEQLIAAFIIKERQERYRFLLTCGEKTRRNECLDRLNHCRDLEEKTVTWLPRDPRSITRDEEIAESLRAKGSPEQVYVFGGDDSIDGRMLPLMEALQAVTTTGWGTLISCLPGRLAYYYDEQGERRAILERNSARRPRT